MVIILYTMQSQAKLTGFLLEAKFFLSFSDSTVLVINPRTYMQIHTPTVVQGGGVDGPPLEFLICCSISKRFYLQWKAFDILYKMRYILWVLTLLGGLWRCQKWSPSWILPRIKNQVKTINHKSLEWTTECVYESKYVVNGLKWKHQVDVDVTTLNRKKI